MISEQPIPYPGPEVDPIRNSQECGQVDALVLAGGSAEALDPAYPAKGLFPVAGRPLIAWVVDALSEAHAIRKIVVVIPVSEGLGEWTERVDQVVVYDGSFSDNLGAGMDALPKNLMVMGVTGDIPILTPEAIDDLVAQTLARKAAASYPLISADDMKEQVPGSVRTYFKLKSGRYTGGNAIVGDPRLFPQVHDLMQELFEKRKSSFAMLQLIGFSFVAKLALGLLEPKDVEKKLTDLIDAPCAAIYTRFACIGADVDKLEDIAPVENILEK